MSFQLWCLWKLFVVVSKSIWLVGFTLLFPICFMSDISGKWIPVCWCDISIVMSWKTVCCWHGNADYHVLASASFWWHRQDKVWSLLNPEEKEKSCFVKEHIFNLYQLFPNNFWKKWSSFWATHCTVLSTVCLCLEI